MRDRSAVVIIQDQKVLLIKRVKKEEVYYVFPGGGIEEGETPEEAAIKEAFEELGVTVKIVKIISTIKFHGNQFYFLAHITAGVVGTGSGAEYVSKQKGTYTPIYVSISDLQSIDVIPKEIARYVLANHR